MANIFTKGTPLTVIWYLTKPDGTAFDLNGYNYRLFYSVGDRSTEVRDSASSGNTVQWVMPAEKQTAGGDYSLRLLLYQNGKLYLTLRYNKAFAFFHGATTDSSEETQTGNQNLVELFTAAEYYLFSPVIPVVGDDGYWYVNGVKVTDGSGNPVPASHTVEYDAETDHIIIDRGRVDGQGHSITQTITLLADVDAAENQRREAEEGRIATEKRMQGLIDNIVVNFLADTDVYERAVEQGFEGTREEWLASAFGVKGVGIESWDIEQSLDDSGITEHTITLNNKEIITFKVKNGVGIASVDQIVTSHESDGINVVRITFSDNTYRDFSFKNGSQGNSGYTGAAGELEVVNNLNQGGATKALSAEQGKILKNLLDGIRYAECTTPAATAAKLVTAANFQLKKGVQFRVKFSEANTAANPTLNIGGTGALPIVYDGEAASATNSWEADEVVLVYYDGTSWQASAAQGGAGKFASGEKVKYTPITDKVETGNALVTTGAVYRDAALVNYKSSPVYDNEAIQQYIRANVVANGVRDGRLTGDNAFDSLVVPVEPGKSYVIRGLQNTGKNDADNGNIFFYSADPSGAYTVIDSIIVDFIPGAPVVVNIPEGATYLVVGVTCRGFTPAQGGAPMVFDSAPTVSLDVLQGIDLTNLANKITDVATSVHFRSEAPIYLSNSELQAYVRPNTYWNDTLPGYPIQSGDVKFDLMLIPTHGRRKIVFSWTSEFDFTVGVDAIFYAGQGIGFISATHLPFIGSPSDGWTCRADIPEGAGYVAIYSRVSEYAGYNFNIRTSITAELSGAPVYLVDNVGKYIMGSVMRRKYTDYALNNSDLAPYIKGNTVIDGANGRIIGSLTFDSLIMPVIGGERITLNGLKWYGTVPTDIGEIWFYTGTGQPTAVLSYIRASREPDVPVVVDVPVTATFMGIVITARNFSVSGQVLNYDASATVNVNVVNGPAIYTIWGTPTGDEIEQRLANSGSGGGGAAPSFDMGLPRDLPKVYITSELLTVVKDSAGKPTNQIRPLTTSKNEVGDLDLEDVKIRIESDTVNFEDAIVISYQGQSSLTAAKKNFSIDTKKKHRFGKWLPMDGFHLKGYNSDWLHIRDIMSNRIYEQMLQTRHPEQRRPFCEANDFDEQDVALLVESGVLCHIDGFPIELYINGEYWGVYSWNLKKHRSNYHLGKSDVKNIQIDPNWQTMTPAGWNWKAAEVRNPKSDSGNTEFIEGTIPNDGEVKTWWTNCLNRLAAITTATTLDSLRAWMNIDSWVDTLLLVNFLGDWDIINRNNLYTTWDGDMLSILPYDHDASFGMGLATNPDRISGDVEIASGTNIFDRSIQYAPWLAPLLTILDGELRARYRALRMAGVFSYESIKAQFDAWTMQIGFEAYKSDLKRWSYEGYGNGVTNPGFYDSANKRLAWVKARIAYLDNLYGFGQ